MRRLLSWSLRLLTWYLWSVIETNSCSIIITGVNIWMFNHGCHHDNVCNVLAFVKFDLIKCVYQMVYRHVDCWISPAYVVLTLVYIYLLFFTMYSKFQIYSFRYLFFFFFPFFISFVCLFVSLVINLSIIVENFFQIVQDYNSNGFRQLNLEQKRFDIRRFLKRIQRRRLLKLGLIIVVKFTRNIIVFEVNEMQN